MIHGVTEIGPSTLPIVQGARDRSIPKPGNETGQVRENRGSSLAQHSSESLDSIQKGEKLAEVVAHVQEALNQIQPRIELSVDQELNKVIIRVVDSDSGDVIRQFPTEELQDLQRFLEDHTGVLLTETA